MPRQAGQVDHRKSEGILDAASSLFAERGIDAPMEEIARRAGVSKQTIYNRYGSKEMLLQALFERRRQTVGEPLDPSHADEPLEERISAYVRNMIEAYIASGYFSLMRSAIVSSVTRPDVGRLIYESGPRLGRKRIADFLRRESDAGRLAMADPDGAADILFGMAVGASIMRVLLDVAEDRRPEAIEARAREVARRFIRAYAP
jgi:TetR/AcrR family transcriptional repressor of mexJK operon